jgi:type II secretion system protein D
MIMGSFIIINSPNTKRSAVALLIAVLLSSCAPIVQGHRDSLPLTPAPVVPASRPAGSVSVEIFQPETTADVRIVSEPREKKFLPPKEISSGVRMDFDAVEMRDFIQVVTESLGVNYVVDPAVTGTVTVHTSQTLSGPQLFAAFREILQVHGLDIRHDGSISVIHPVAGVKKRYDLGGVHVRMIAVQNAPTSTLVAELQQALSAIDPGREAVQVVSLDRLQSVMLLSRDASMVDTVSGWVRDLDTIPADARQNIYLYRVRCGLASELSRLINALLYSATVSDSMTWSSSNNPSPTVPPVPPSPAQARADSISPAPVMSSYTPPPAATPGRPNTPTIIPDDSGNVLLIRSTGGEHSRIVKVLEQLDTVPRQVLIDVLVAEVTLGDSLSFGVEWALKSGAIKIGGSKLNPTATTSFTGVSASATGGFAFALLNAAADPVAVVNALASQTDVSLISSPQIFVQNNKTALVKVGDRVPIVTTQTERLGTDQPTTDKTVTYNDTGTILIVTPRIHHDGMVSLDVTQQVSNAIANKTSSISSPVIQTREIKTSLSIRDGQPVILGGLISRGKTNTGNKVPFLGDLPGVGHLFRFDSEDTTRTELLVIITPHVVYADSLDQFQANYKPVSDELRTRLHTTISRDDRHPVFAR